MSKGVLECFLNISDRITEQLIANCDDSISRINDSAIKGFHVRLGVKKIDAPRLASFYFFYRIGGRNGRQVNYFIGNSENMDAGLARRIALQIQPHVEAGKDIAKMKFEAEKEQVRLKDFWRYLGRDYINDRYSRGGEICTMIEKHILPAIGSVHLTKLSERIIVLRVVDPLIEQNKSSLVKSLMSYFKQLLLFAVQKEYLNQLPLQTTIQVPKQIIKDESKEMSSLTGAQLKGIYYRAHKDTSQSAYLFTLQLQILSGQTLATICRAFRQDIKGNKWLLRGRDGKLSGVVIPLDGPLKKLLKQGVKSFSNAQSLYLLPGKGARAKADKGMDPKSLAKLQQQFIKEVHNHKCSMSQLLKDIEKAMISLGIEPRVVAYLFHRKLESYLALDADDPMVQQGLNQWYRG